MGFDFGVTFSHGYPMIFFERRMVIDVLYRNIRQKDKVLTSRRVVGFQQDEHGVVVECQDGSVYRGSILIGADGIRSTVARKMSELNGTSKKGKYASRAISVTLFYVQYVGTRALWRTLGVQRDALDTFGSH